MEKCFNLVNLDLKKLNRDILTEVVAGSCELSGNTFNHQGVGQQTHHVGCLDLYDKARLWQPKVSVFRAVSPITR